MLSKKIVAILGIILILIYINTMSGCSTNSTSPTTGGIEIIVMDKSGNYLNGTKVVSDVQPEGMLKVTGITSENEKGVVFNDLIPGQYKFHISRQDYQDTYININVLAGKKLKMTVSLAPNSITQ